MTLVASQSLMYNTSMGTKWNMSDEGKNKISAYARVRYEHNSKIVTCANCNKKYKVALSRWNNGRGRYCSRSCQAIAKKGIRYSPETEFKKGQAAWNLGLPGPRGDQSYSWKGDNVDYSGLHKWVKRSYDWDNVCSKCGKQDGLLDLANITGIYNRDKGNWLILCRGCHIKEDHHNPKHPPYEMRKGW